MIEVSEYNEVSEYSEYDKNVKVLNKHLNMIEVSGENSIRLN